MLTGFCCLLDCAGFAPPTVATFDKPFLKVALVVPLAGLELFAARVLPLSAVLELLAVFVLERGPALTPFLSAFAPRAAVEALTPFLVVLTPPFVASLLPLRVAFEALTPVLVVLTPPFVVSLLPLSEAFEPFTPLAAAVLLRRAAVAPFTVDLAPLVAATLELADGFTPPALASAAFFAAAFLAK